MTNSSTSIEIATQFSAFPAGRDDTDGPFNGQRFQREHLLEAVKNAKAQKRHVLVSLNGLMSCGSSFLEEAFGGLVRDNHIEKRELLKVLSIVYSAPNLKRYHDAIFRYIDEARPKK